MQDNASSSISYLRHLFIPPIRVFESLTLFPVFDWVDCSLDMRIFIDPHDGYLKDIYETWLDI